MLRSQNIFVYKFRLFFCTSITALAEVKQRLLSRFSPSILDHISNPAKVAQHPVKVDLLRDWQSRHFLKACLHQTIYCSPFLFAGTSLFAFAIHTCTLWALSCSWRELSLCLHEENQTQVVCFTWCRYTPRQDWLLHLEQSSTLFKKILSPKMPLYAVCFKNTKTILPPMLLLW